MQTSATLHSVSDFLYDRHPYLPEEKSDKLEVCVAYGKRGVAKLVDISRDPTQTDTEVCSALALLYNLLGSQEKKSDAVRCDVVTAMTRILGSTTASPATRANAALVLAAIAQVYDGRAAINAAKSVAALANGVGDADARVRTACSTALTYISQFRDGWPMIMQTPRAVKQLVASLDVHDESVLVFVSLTGLFDEGAEEALKQGVMPKLVALLGRSQVTVIRRAGLQALRNLVNNAGGKEKALRSGAVAAAAERLGDKDTQVRLFAAGSILTMCVNQDGKPLFLECGPVAVANMVRLLRDADERVRINATLAIRNLSELPAAKAAFVAVLVADLEMLDHVFASSCAPELCELLARRDSDMRHDAVTAIEFFCRTPEGQHNIANALHIVARLAGLVASNDSRATKAAAANSLQTLCLTFPDVKTEFSALVQSADQGLLKAALLDFETLAAFAR